MALKRAGSDVGRVALKRTGAVDYRIWGLMQQHLYKTLVRDTIDLKKRLVDTWASIPQCVVDEAVDQWTRMREGKRSPVRTSAPVINRFFSEPPDPHHNGSFQSHPHSPEENTLLVCSIEEEEDFA